MKKKAAKLIALAGAVLLAMGSLTDCGNGSSSASGAGSTENSTPGAALGSSAGSGPAGNEQLSGSILMVGSTSMDTYAGALAERYMELHKDVTVSVEFVGSGAGIEAVLSGTADIGNSSRNLKDEEKARGGVENIVAIDGMVVCIHSANNMTDLTRQQLIDIYTGEVTNWSEVDGQDIPIVVVGREAGSGTRSAFEEILGIQDICAYANVLDSAGAVLARVASTPGAIGYVSLDVVDDTVIVLELDGVAPTPENIKAGSYLLCRPFVMATMGEISDQSELIQDWFHFVLGEEGQSIAASVGLITVE